MKSILFYNLNGMVEKEIELTKENLKQINGMLTKITLEDGTEKVGYIQILKPDEYITLWIWKNIDEEKHILVGNDDSKYEKIFQEVQINIIEKVQVKLYSNPRWGGKLTNKFEYNKLSDGDQKSNHSTVPLQSNPGTIRKIWKIEKIGNTK